MQYYISCDSLRKPPSKASVSQMIVDFVLLVIVTLLGVGLTVVGGVVASEKLWVRLCFVIGGPILVIGIISQGVRQIQAQRNSDNAYMRAVQDSKDDRQRSDTKIDALYALLEPRLNEPPPVAPGRLYSKKPTQQPPAAPEQPVLPPNSAQLRISQTSKSSTRPDAPYQTEVVIQTTASFPSLKLLLQCDEPIVDVHPSIGGTGGLVQMMVSFGVLKDHPNVVAYSYDSSTPPFGPANPVVIDVWSKNPAKCSQAATF
jgi:hypothetical protein